MSALGQRRRLGLRGGHCGLRAGDIELAANAALETASYQPELFLAQINRARDRRNFSVQRADCKIVLRHVGLERKQDVIERSERCLGVRAGALKTATHATPEIDLVAQIERRAERISGYRTEARRRGRR